jgi:DNA-binding NtrC family response regulator
MKKSIVYLDDDECLREAVGHILTLHFKDKYNIIVKERGEEIQGLNQQEIAMVLTDYNMNSDWNGYHVVLFCDIYSIPVVLFSSDSKEKILSENDSTFFPAGYLQKPAGLSTIQNFISEFEKSNNICAQI